MDNIESITMFAQSQKNILDVLNGFITKYRFPIYSHFMKNMKFTEWQLYLKYGYLVVVSVKLVYLVIWCINGKNIYKRDRKHGQVLYVDRLGHPGRVQNRNSLDARRFTR